MSLKKQEINPVQYLGKCQRPKLFKNRRGQEILTSCGLCPECLGRKAIKKSKQARDMCSLFKHVYFYTLTYNEQNVPVCKVSISEELWKDDFSESSHICTKVDFTDVTIRTNYNKDNQPCFNFSDRYGQIVSRFELHTDEEKNKFNAFTAKARPLSFNKDKYADGLYIRVIDNTDLQKFIKRLRFNIAQKFDAEIKHFSVSEYGPKTFRPHFHGLIMFNSDELLPHIEEFISKSWKYGDVNSSYVRNSSTASSYVAGYINSYSCVPFFLQSKQVAPRSFHSVRVFGEIHREIRDFIYKSPCRVFESQCFHLSSGDYEYHCTREIINQLFPRCYSYAQSDKYSRKFLYTIFDKLYRKTGYTKISDLTRYCIFNYDDTNNYYIRKLFRLLEITDNEFYIDKKIYPSLLYFDPAFKKFASGDYDEIIKNFELDISDYERLYMRVYSAILLSKHFQTFCCENLSTDDAFEMIIKFHDKTSPLNTLRSQYFNLNLFIDECSSSPNDTSLFYTMTPQVSCIDVDTGELYDVNPLELFSNNRFMQYYFRSREVTYKSQIKHKELNELNYNMFN